MKKLILSLTGLLLAIFLLYSCSKDNNSETGEDINQKSSGNYDADATVYVKAASNINLTNNTAKSVTLPLLQGWTPNGEKAYYFITESSDYADAKKLGVSYSPIMKNAIGSQGVQNVTRGSDGRIQFKGNVDFSVVRVLIQGSPNVFPPSTVIPGAIGDAEYSPFIVLNGIVYNAPMVANNTGVQDRVLSIDYNTMTVTLLLSDGLFAGKQYFYHLVTDASDPVPAAIENGIFAPPIKEPAKLWQKHTIRCILSQRICFGRQWPYRNK